MTLADHLTDDVLSLLVDEQLSPAELRAARAHLDTCPLCQQRVAELRTLTGLLRRLPEVDPPRDFSLGPRAVGVPANVVRLERWYTWSRAAAASLAAVFVFLVAGTVYLDSATAPARPAAFQTSADQGGVAASGPKSAAPAAPAPAPTTAPAAARDAARPGAVAAPPAAAQAQASPGAARALQSAPAAEAGAAAAVPTTEPADLTAAATSAQPLPTVAPTTPPIAPTPAPARAIAEGPRAADPAAPVRAAASVVGIVAIIVLLGALVVRHRLNRTRASILTQE